MGGSDPVIIEDLAKDTHLFDLQTYMTDYTSTLCPMSFRHGLTKLEEHNISPWVEECESSTQNLITVPEVVERPAGGVCPENKRLLYHGLSLRSRW